MQKTHTNPSVVAGPFASYSHSVRVSFGGGALVYVAGQLPLDEAGDLVGEDAAGQADQVLRNVAAILEANGASLRDVVSTTTYLTDITQLAAVNEVRGRHFPQEPPTSTTVEVSALAKQCQVEINAVAAVGPTEDAPDEG